MAQRPSSPRRQLSSLLLGKLGVPEDSLDAVMAEAQEKLTASDAENKLHNRKLYLVIDLDETLVYSKRLEPGATPVGSLIYVRGQPFDMQPRPGLQHFLQMAASSYIVFLYTMGDADYVHAVMNVIDPERQYFRGGMCCWRPTESRQSKSLARVLTEKRMTLVVDDSIDVWAEDLPNLCLTRRFVGDKLDDGLQLLSWQLKLAHRAFYQDVPPEGYSYEATMARAPPSLPNVLRETRGTLLSGCTIALTGVVSDQREEHAEVQPLCVLIRLYGGEYTLNVDAATHLVARRKDGWQRSPKISRALNRIQEGASNFYAVWDHWLLDTLASWQKQSEASYAISLDEERGESPPPTFHDHVAQQLAGIKREHVADDMSDALTSVPLNSGVPLRKRKAPEADDLPHSQIFRT
eukprot:jgi/Chrpa1/1730/Chrysochromulina_OHIO_Genome00002146-RA